MEVHLDRSGGDPGLAVDPCGSGAYAAPWPDYSIRTELRTSTESDEDLVWNARFVDIISDPVDGGRRRIDYGRFHDVEDDATT